MSIIKFTISLAAQLVVLGLPALFTLAYAQNLYDFTAANMEPVSGITEIGDGAWAGAAIDLTSNDSIIYSLNFQGTFGTLHTFPGTTCAPAGAPYSFPNQPLQGSDGALYGTVFSCQYNFIYRLDLSGGYVQLKRLWAQRNPTPIGGLLETNDGRLWGAVSDFAYSYIFNIKKDGSGFKAISTYTGSANIPLGDLVKGADGMIYGASQGNIFRVNPSTDTFSLVAAVNGDTGGPLTAGIDGLLYGTTLAGGASACGNIYSFNPKTLAITDLYDFALPLCMGGGVYSTNMIQTDDGMLYGVISNAPTFTDTVFQFNPVTHALTTSVYNSVFGFLNLIQSVRLGLMGVTQPNGIRAGGAVFQYPSATPLPAPRITALVPNSGPVGSVINIRGNYLYDGFTVSFNGVSASSVITSEQSIRATVPAGATTGPITVTAVNGTAVSSGNFTVQ